MPAWKRHRGKGITRFFWIDASSRVVLRIPSLALAASGLIFLGIFFLSLWT